METAKQVREAETDMYVATEEAKIPDAVIEESAELEKPEESRMIADDFGDVMDSIHPKDEIRLKWAELVSDARRHRIRDCVVLGGAVAPNRAGVNTITKLNDFRTFIKADEFFLPGTFSANIGTVSEEVRQERQLQMIQKMLGAHMRVIITNAASVYADGEKTYSVAASRVMAADVMKNYYFFGRRSQRHMPKVGDTVKARILLVSESSVRVEACGIESRVPYALLTGRRHLSSRNVLEHFSKDQAVWMSVVNMEVDKENRTVDWRLSHRAVEDEIYKPELSESMIGRRFLGEIVGINDEYYTAYCLAENLPCSIPIRRCMNESRLNYGDQVALEVYGLGDRFLKCNCRKI
ncbi:MAG: hypothetical protein LIO86_13850 [Lachnospiraceae bacterium]|nr:hypothetical protein [Lachnospiraceae bacterium]